MAKVLEQFTDRPARTYYSKLDGWLDGQKWRLDIGDDVTNEAELENLRRSLYRRGKTLGKRVRITTFPTALEVQALPQK